MLRIGIVAGEASGDIIASGLIKEIRSRYPDAIIEGVAGPLMQEAGCRAIYESEKLAVMGFTEVLSQLPEILKIRRLLTAYFVANPPDIFIGVDAPDFNITLEHKLKKNGIKTVHYVSPSVWAWRKYRIKKISRSVDLMLTLFPFEASFYENHNIPVKFVGHPLANEIPLSSDKQIARNHLGLPSGNKIIALLPGSRMSELNQLAGLMIDSAKQCLERSPDLFFVVPLVNSKTRNYFEQELKSKSPGLPLKIIDGKSREVMIAADIILLASGTAALEGLLVNRPMVVTYRVSKLSYLIYNFLVDLDNVSLPNLLAGKSLIPELIQDDATVENIVDAVMKKVNSEENLLELEQSFTEIHKQLRQNASVIAANEVLKLVPDLAERSQTESVA